MMHFRLGFIIDWFGVKVNDGGGGIGKKVGAKKSPEDCSGE